MTLPVQEPSPNTPEHSEQRNGAAAPGTAPRRRGRGWIWYFVLLLVLSVAATVTLIAYNLGQQLTPEKLAAARKLWEEKGPKDYEYRYTRRIAEGDLVDRFHVVVKGSTVRSVTLNDTIQLPKRQLRDYSMEGQFDQIEDFLDLDSKPGRPKVFKVASFSPQDGHLRHYVRSVMGTRERVEIFVDEFKGPDGKGQK